MQHLDKQMQRWATRLRDDLKIGSSESNCLATTIASEVSKYSAALLHDLQNDSPIPLSARLDELSTFQAFMDIAHLVPHSPAITRARVITTNYVCFVYLGDAWFKQLGKSVPSNTTTKKCVLFLTDNPVRAFRNAVAHANWKYKSDYSGLEFWARKGAAPEEAMERFEVSQIDLNFWQALARCTAYASILAVKDAT